MPVDARIALAGIPQEYNAFGAYNTSRAAEQTFRQNQMIQQAARDTAEMNRNAMAAAQTLDPTDQAAMRAYVARYGPAAAPIIEGLSGVDNMFTARNTDARAQGEFDTKQRVDLRDFLQREVGSFLNDPSDANIAASRARAIATGIDAADFDAYVAPYTALPVEQRPDRLRNELATSADGLKLLERFAPAYDMQNAGGSIVPVQTNPLAPGATPPRPITVTADPNRQQLVQDANGNWVSVNPNTNSGAPVTLPDGSPVTGRVPGTPAPGTNADGTQAASAQTLRNVLGQLRTNFDVLYPGRKRCAVHRRSGPRRARSASGGEQRGGHGFWKRRGPAVHRDQHPVGALRHVFARDGRRQGDGERSGDLRRPEPDDRSRAEHGGYRPAPRR